MYGAALLPRALAEARLQPAVEVGGDGMLVKGQTTALRGGVVHAAPPVSGEQGMWRVCSFCVMGGDSMHRVEMQFMPWGLCESVGAFRALLDLAGQYREHMPWLHWHGVDPGMEKAVKTFCNAVQGAKKKALQHVPLPQCSMFLLAP